MKKIVQVDMDGVLCDYEKTHRESLEKYPNIPYPQSMPGFYLNLEPMPRAIEAMRLLSKIYDVRILTAPSNKNPLSYTEKRLWVENHLGYEFVEGITMSSYKDSVSGDYLIDDKSDSHGQDKFKGELIHFGTSEFPDWLSVYCYLLDQIQKE